MRTQEQADAVGDVDEDDLVELDTIMDCDDISEGEKADVSKYAIDRSAVVKPEEVKVAL